MPKTLGGAIGFIVSAVVMVTIGLWVINRVAPLQAIVARKQAA